MAEAQEGVVTYLINAVSSPREYQLPHTQELEQRGTKDLGEVFSAPTYTSINLHAVYLRGGLRIPAVSLTSRSRRIVSKPVHVIDKLAIALSVSNHEYGTPDRLRFPLVPWLVVHTRKLAIPTRDTP